MFTVYYYGSDDKYHSYNGDKFRSSFKRPQGFEVKKGYTTTQKGLKKFHSRVKKDCQELVDLGITKKNVTTYDNEIQAKFYLLNVFLPEKFQMTKGKKLFSCYPSINLEEHIMIKNCNNVGLLYTQKGIFKFVSAYDVNSFYSRVLGYQNSQFKIPISEPIFKVLDTLPDKLEYGIYRVLITYKGKPEDDVNKLFNFSKNHYYTHIDLKSALWLQTKYDNFKVQLICDDSPNAMIYTKFIRSKVLFGKWFNHFNKGKKKAKGNMIIKQLMNIWGYLCQYTKLIRKSETTIDKWSSEKQKKYDFQFYKVIKGEQFFELQKKTNIYRYTLGRMKPFLLATVRQRMRDYIISSNKIGKIIRIYIDSFILSEDSDFFEEKTESIKHDKYHKKDVEIKALNDIKIMN